jgi:DNA-binding GntR family transcriptional regulator
MTKVERVCESITRRIEARALIEGDRLPSEAQLARQLAVSVGTVQKALGQLSSGGLITREHGRGTFVAGSRVQASDVSYLRFLDGAGRELPNFMRLRSVRRIRSRGPWSDFLGPSPSYVRIERLIDVGAAVTLHSAFWLRQEEFDHLNRPGRQALEKNLRVLISQKLSLPTLRIDQWIRFQKAPALVASALRLRAGALVFSMDMRGYTLRDRPLYFQRIHAPPFAVNLAVVR